MITFLDITLFCLVEIVRRFRGACCFYYQGDSHRPYKGGSKQGASSQNKVIYMFITNI
jgi:hypothetical protein